MADISAIIAPKSDQLNADDLVTGPRTIRIREVKVLGAGREQPISVFYEGDNGKPWKPCKIMARLLAGMWSPDTSKWVGRSVQLYRDPDVKWAGAKVGGIRVRAVSHIDASVTVALSESQKSRKLAKIDVISAEVTPMHQTDKAADWARDHIASLSGAAMLGDLEGMIASAARFTAKLRTERPELFAQVEAAYAARRLELTPGGKTEPEQGEGFTDADASEWGE